MYRTKRECYGVPASISWFNDSRLLPLGNFKEHGVHHKTINTVGTERSDWTSHQWYSISNNPDSMSLCLMSLLGVYCGRRWTFWACTSLEVKGIEHNTDCISVSFCCWEIMFERVYTSIWDTLFSGITVSTFSLGILVYNYYTQIKLFQFIHCMPHWQQTLSLSITMYSHVSNDKCTYFIKIIIK